MVAIVMVDRCGHERDPGRPGWGRRAIVTVNPNRRSPSHPSSTMADVLVVTSDRSLRDPGTDRIPAEAAPYAIVRMYHRERKDRECASEGDEVTSTVRSRP